MLNTVVLVGRLGRDPEKRSTQSGVAVCSFSLACDDYNQKGEKKTDWVDCTAWRQAAERMGEAHKGDLVLVAGKVSSREWTDRQGKTRKQTEVTVKMLRMLTPKPLAAAATVGRQPGDEEPEITDEDVPF